MKKGLLITLLFIMIVLILIGLGAGYVYYQFNREPNIPSDSYLKIYLSGNIVDNDNSVVPKNITVRDIWYHLKRAEKDERIKGVILKLSYLQTGFAKTDDIGRIIKNFRKSGKKVYTYIESGGIRELQLASYTDKIYIYKQSGLALNGLAIQAVFLKNALTKLGIEADFLNVGSYKTGPNMFTKNEMTAYHRESLTELIDNIYNSSIKIISSNRNVEEKIIRELIEEFTTDGEKILKSGLVDGLKYENEIINEKKDKVVNFSLYKETTSPAPFKGKEKIAVIFTQGEIHSGSSGGKSYFGNEIMGSDSVSKYLRAARKNKSVKGVVLRVDSPGGSPFASDIIRHEAELVMKEKPLVISMSDTAASGGYMISLSSSRIFALPQTITGSIGVYGGKFVLKGLYDKLGVNKEVIKTSKFANMFSDYRTFNEEERKKYMSVMDDIYKLFVDEVVKGRKIPENEISNVAEGRVWSGLRAKPLNLIDEWGGLNDAVNEAVKLSGIDKSKGFGMTIYPRAKSLFDYFMDLLGSGSTGIISEMRSGLERYRNFFPAMIIPFQIVVD
ncbi:MAG: signal peptide peptidase SppA [Acidobacteriota bacterium]